jgi:hypothetical protein
MIERAHAGIRKILGIDELISIPPAANHPYPAAFVDELEEYREQSQTSRIDDGGTADDDGVQVTTVLPENFFTLVFRTSIDLDGIRFVVLRDWFVKSLAPNTIGGREDYARNTMLPGQFSDVSGSVHIGSPKEVFIFDGMRKNGRAMDNGIEPILTVETIEAGNISDVSLNRCQIRMPIGIRAEVDTDTSMTGFEQPRL